MDQIHAILSGSIPSQCNSKTAKSYDGAAKEVLHTITANASAVKGAVLTEGLSLLETLDPTVNTIGFLYTIDVLLGALSQGVLPVPQNTLLDWIVDFVLKFDPVQIRYAGKPMFDLLDRIASGQLFPPLVAVRLLGVAILRLDPSGSTFTSTHLALARLAYTSNAVDPAFEVLDKDILFYSNMAGVKESRPICDPGIPASTYLSPHTGLTDAIKVPMVLEYNFVRALCYMSRRDWHRAEMALEQIITHPSKDKGASKIMVEAYKKWTLVSLLKDGKTPTLPVYTSTSAKSAYTATAKPYINIAEQFTTTNAADIKAEVEEHTKVWDDDGNTSLVALVLAAYQKWQIIGLRHIYRRIPIVQVRQLTRNAETGSELVDDNAVIALVNQMIEDGMLDGGLERDGTDMYLAFRDGDAVPETEFARQVAQSHGNIEALSKHYRLTNERLSNSKEYVRYVAREKNRAEKDAPDAGIGFDAQIEDEDLMSGVVAHP